MAITKTPTTLVNNQTIAAGSSYTSTVILDLAGAIDFSLGYKMSFNASSPSGATIYLFADPTGANASFAPGSYDDPADSIDVAVDAGHTVNGLGQISRSGRYVTVKVVNNSSGYSITGVSVYGIVQAQS